MMLGSQLVSLRKSEGKTQKEISEILGVTRPTYTAYETGKRNPDYDMLEKIADYFHVSTDYLLGRSSIRSNQHSSFIAFPNDPLLQQWYSELPFADEADVQKIQKIWEIIRRK